VNHVRRRRSPRAWRGDVGLIALAVLLGGLFFVDSVKTATEPGAPNHTTDLLVGTLACAALLLRRRWPVALALALIPSLAFSAFAMGATAIAIGAVALYRSWRVTAAVLALHTVWVVTLFGLAARDPREFWQGLLVMLALDAAMVASGLLVRSQRLLVRSLEERAREAEEGQRLRVEEARHTERERIAREMHDVLAHRISLLAVHAGALEVRRSAPDEERQAAAVIRQCAYAALEDLREVIGMLRDDPAADADRPQPTLTDLPALIEQSRQVGARITLDDNLADLPAAPDGIGRHVYRIVQEGLTNARKHAPGEPVRVRLAGSPVPATAAGAAPATNQRPADGVGLIVEVTNPLPASAAAAQIPGAGSGLIGLSERMNLLGGRLEHGRTPDGEFRLRAWLPWRS
jgi:signal transduction histidine kinase